MLQRLWDHELRTPLLVLACASLIAVGLVFTRAVLTWRGHQLFLVWNLFLAWLPLFLAFRLEALIEGKARPYSVGMHGIAWLLFFPNAPYILTDLTHLKAMFRWSWWTDLMLISLFAIIGLVLAFVSLHRVQLLVARKRGWVAGWIFVPVVALLSGFGVYIGRFERWNTWDVVVNPLGLIQDSFTWFHLRSIKFTLLFGLLLGTTYALLYSLTLLRRLETVPAIRGRGEMGV